MSKLLSPVGNTQQFDNSGKMLTNGTISVYQNGTLNLATIYANAAGGALSNPISLNAAGRIANGQLYLDNGVTYDIEIKTSTGVTVETYTSIIGLPDALSAGIAGNVVTSYFTVTSVPTTVFTLSYTPLDASLLQIFVDGLALSQDDFTLAGTQITLLASPQLNAQVMVKYSRQTTYDASLQYTKNNIVDTITTTTAVDYTLSQNPAAQSNLFVILDGIVLTPNDDYTWSVYAPTTIHLNFTPTSGQNLIVHYRDATPVLLLAGTTALRPTGLATVGTQYYDVSIKKPLWFDGTYWRDANGLTV